MRARIGRLLAIAVVAGFLAGCAGQPVNAPAYVYTPPNGPFPASTN